LTTIEKERYGRRDLTKGSKHIMTILISSLLAIAYDVQQSRVCVRRISEGVGTKIYVKIFYTTVSRIVVKSKNAWKAESGV